MRVVIQHVPDQRQDTLLEIMRVFPAAIVVPCRGNPKETFVRTISELRGEGGLFFEDDAVLSSRFRAAIEVCRGTAPVTFYKRDKMPDGLHRKPASSWICNVGWWCPPGFSEKVLAWVETNAPTDTAFDIWVRRTLVEHRMHYFAYYPSLVQHAVGPSLLGSRARDRRSPTWIP